MRKEELHISDHSEPVQEIMGTIPSWITRWGVTIIFSILFLVLVGCCIIRHPETVTGTVELTSSDSTGIHGCVVVSSTGIGKISVGQQTNIRLNGFPYMEFGIVRGIISDVSYTPERDKDGRTGYALCVLFPDGLQTSYGKELPFIEGMDGTAEIITDDRRLITVFMYPLKSILRNR